MLSFPRAPRGSVSIQVWGIACASVIALLGEAAVAVFVLFGSGKGIVGKNDGGKEEKQGEKIEMKAR